MSPLCVTLYGIPNCDTVKKSRAWLIQHGVEIRFVDLKKSGVPEAHLARWMAAVGWQPLVNRRGTTWRALSAEAKAAVVDASSAAAVLRAQPTLVKRPVIEWGAAAADVTVGFVPDDWRARIAAVAP